MNRVLYVRLERDRLTLRDPKTGETISEVPEIALLAGKTVVAVGAEARQRAAGTTAQVSNPFLHPRSLLSDFTLAEQVLRSFVRRMGSHSRFARAPTVVFHPLGEHPGGLTQIEVRAMHELAMSAGAASVVVWQGPPLSDRQLLNREFPCGGTVLS